MKPHIQNLKMCEVPKFASELIKEPFTHISNIKNQIIDEYACSILSSYGTNSILIKKLSDNRHDWVGSIFCEFLQPMTILEEDANKILEKASITIQYILPEIDNKSNI